MLSAASSWAVRTLCCALQSYFHPLTVTQVHWCLCTEKETERVFSKTSEVRKAAIMTRVMGLIHELCKSGIHSTKRDIFYTDVKLFKKQDESDGEAIADP